MAKTIVGLDIGSEYIRAVELADAGKLKPRLVRFHEVVVPEGAVRRGEVVEPNTVAGLLKRLWHEGGFKSKRVVLGMGNQRVFARDLSVPKAPLSRIRESLPFSVQDMLPLPVADAIMDFFPISETVGDHGTMVNGLLIAAVKDAVLGNVKAVQLAGLTPVEVDLIPFALDRALVTRQRRAGTVAIVDVGASTTSVTVASNGVPQFVRIISSGGFDITSAIAGRLGIGIVEADEAKKRLGLAKSVGNQTEQDQVGVIYELVKDMLSSLRNTISYFSSTRPHDPVTAIVLSGGGSQLTGFAEALAEFTRLPVSIGDPLAAVTLGRGVDRAEAARYGVSLAVPLGLALGSVAA